MQVRNARHALASAVVCLILTAGCNCGHTTTRKITKPPVVEALGGVSCDGEAVQLTPLITGGQAPFTYQWEPADGLSDPHSERPFATVPETRWYHLIVTDAKGWVATADTKVDRRRPPTIRLAFAQGAQQVCNGNQVELDASASRTSTGSPVSAYFWELGGHAPTPGPASATSGAFVPANGQVVKLKVTDEVGCQSTVEQPLAVRALPNAQIAFAQGAAEVCDGDLVSLSGAATDADGKPVSNLAWDLDGDATTLEELGQQTKPFRPTSTTPPARLVATDAAGCRTAITQRLAVNPLPQPAVRYAVGKADACEGSPISLDASASTDGRGGAVARYAWNLDGDPSTIESTSAVSPAIPAQGTTSISVTVFSAKGCASTLTETVVARALPLPRITFEQGRANACLGDAVTLSSTGSVDASGQPVSRAEWDLNNDNMIDASGLLSPSLTPSGSRTVKLLVTDQFGCQAAATQQLDPRPLPTPVIRFAQGAAAICSGDKVSLDGSASVDADGKPISTFAWDLDGNSATTESIATGSGLFTPGPSPVRLAVVDSLGCKGSTTQAITTNLRPTARITWSSGVNNVCDGVSIGVSGSNSTDANGAPVKSFAWDLDGNPSTIESTSITPPMFSPTSSRPVQLTVTDANGCTSAATDTLTVFPRPTARITFIAGKANACMGTNVGLSGATSTDAKGAAVKSFAWDLDDNTSTTESTAAAPGAFSLSSARQVQLKVTDANGCTNLATQALTPRGLPTARITFASGRSNVCMGDTISLSGQTSTDADGNAVTSYFWQSTDLTSTLNPSVATTPAFKPTQPQTAKLMVVDAQGCQAETTQAIEPRALPTPVVAFTQGAATICAGAQIALDGSGSRDADGNIVASYAWDLDGNRTTVESTTATTGTFAPSAGSVQLSVVDGLGCKSSMVQPTVTNALPVARISFTSGAANACDGSTVGLTAATSTLASGASVKSYAWDLDGNTATTESTSVAPPTFALTSARQVQLKLTDTNGCSSVATQALTPRGLPTARITFASGRSNVCMGDTISLSGQTSTDAEGNAVASYYWQSTDLTGTLNPSVATTPAFKPTQPQTAKLVVVDAQGCQAETTQAIEPRALPTPVVEFTQGAAAICAGAQIALDGSGSRDADGNIVASYAWDLDGNRTTVESNNVATGTFQPTAGSVQLAVMDGLGCKSSVVQATVTNALPTARITYAAGTNNVCQNSSVALDGSASSAASGATLKSFAWDLDGDPSTIESNLAKPATLWPTGAQDVHLTVTDSNGCTAQAYDYLTIVPLPTASFTFTQGAPTVCSGTTVAVNGSASRDGAGQPVARYQWDLDGNASTTESTVAAPAAFPATTGAPLTLKVFDSYGCSAATSQTLTVRPLPAAVAGTGGSLCSGSSMRLGAAAASGVTYQWSPATGLDNATSSSPLATPASSTSYTLTATNQHGCTATSSTTVGVFPMPVADAGPDRQVAAGGTVQLLGAASGGKPSYAYAWTPPMGLSNATLVQPAATGLTSTTYNLTVIDANGCQASDSMNLQVLPSLAVSATPDRNLCMNNATSAPLAATVSGGVPPFSYAWTASPACAGCIASPTSATTSVSPTTTTTFTVKVTDATGTQSTAQTTVTVLSGIFADAGPDRRIHYGETTQLGAATTPGLSYSWTCSTGSCGLVNPTTSNPYATPPGTIAYTVTATDGMSCYASDTVIVSMEPRILAAVPYENHTMWTRDSPMFVIFDSDIDPATLTNNVWVLDPSDGQRVYTSWSYDAAARILTIKPESRCTGVVNCTGDKQYKNNMPHLLVVKGGPGGVATPAPNPMTLVNDFTVEFNVSSMGDGVAPAMTYQYPAASATGVSRNAQLVVSFNEPFDPRTVKNTTVFINGVAGTVTYDARTWSVFFKPSAPLNANQTYTATVNGVKDSSGNATVASWTFTTGASFDTQAPSVVSTDLTADATNVDVAATFSATFSEQIDYLSLGGVTVVKQSTGHPVVGELFWDPATRTATFNPTGFLDPSTVYQFVIAGVFDHAGLAVPVTSVSFTTQSALLMERFDTTPAGWTFDSPWGLDYQAAHTGAFGLSDSPNVSYGASWNKSATTGVINVSGRSSVGLSIWSRRALATDQDKALVEYSTNGTTWTTAATLQGATGWRVLSYTIPTGGSATLRIRLRLTTDSSLNLDGWSVDDFVIR
jgi:hypothetical protein